MKLTELVKQMKNEGLRMTKIRTALLSVLCQAKTPLNNSEILTQLASQGLRPNKTTIYRELYLLHEHGLIHEIILRDGSQRYELNTSEHRHHLVCSNCGRVETVELAGDLDKIESQIADKTHFHIKRHDLTFYGQCDDCN